MSDYITYRDVTWEPKHVLTMPGCDSLNLQAGDYLICKRVATASQPEMSLEDELANELGPTLWPHVSVAVLALCRIMERRLKGFGKTL